MLHLLFLTSLFVVGYVSAVPHDVSDAPELTHDVLSSIGEILSERFLDNPWDNDTDIVAIKNMRQASKHLKTSTKQGFDRAALLAAWRHCGKEVLPLFSPVVSIFAESIYQTIYKPDMWNDWNYLRSDGLVLDLRDVSYECTEHLLNPSFPYHQLSASSIKELKLRILPLIQAGTSLRHAQNVFQIIQRLASNNTLSPSTVSINFDGEDDYRDITEFEILYNRMLEFVSSLPSVVNLELDCFHPNYATSVQSHSFKSVKQLTIDVVAETSIPECKMGNLITSMPKLVAVHVGDGDSADAIPVVSVLTESQIHGVSSTSRYCHNIDFFGMHRLKKLQIIDSIGFDCIQEANFKLNELSVGRDSYNADPLYHESAELFYAFLESQKPTLEKFWIRIDANSGLDRMLTKFMEDNHVLKELAVYEVYTESRVISFDFLRPTNSLETLVLGCWFPFMIDPWRNSRLTSFIEKSTSLKRFFVDLDSQTPDAAQYDLPKENQVHFGSFMQVWSRMVEAIAASSSVREVIFRGAMYYDIPAEDVTREYVIDRIEEFIQSLKPLAELDRVVTFNSIPVKEIIQDPTRRWNMWYIKELINREQLIVNF